MAQTVLYIEDNPANFALVKKVLEASGAYEVIGAETGEEGLATLPEHRVQLILLDLDLPGMSGFEVARELKRDDATRTIPIVAISASVMKHERRDAIRAGCCGFVEKPLDILLLRTTVAEAIAGTLAPPTI